MKEISKTGIRVVRKTEALTSGAEQWRIIGYWMEEDEKKRDIWEMLQLKHDAFNYVERMASELTKKAPVGRIHNSCWLCYINLQAFRVQQDAEKKRDGNCMFCPIEWYDKETTDEVPCESGIYGRWKNNGDLWYDRVFFAYLISELISAEFDKELLKLNTKTAITDRMKVRHVNQEVTECWEHHTMHGWRIVPILNADYWEEYDYIEARHHQEIRKDGTYGPYIKG